MASSVFGDSVTKRQAPGCGFPVARIVAMFCWASGAVLEAAIGAYRKSELPLWRSLWHLMCPGDIVVADRFYCTFADIVGVIRRGCDVVFRLHQRRPDDMRLGKCLGKCDRLVTWQRPKRHARPRGMSVEQWSLLPEELTVRLLRFRVDIPGFRSSDYTAMLVDLIPELSNALSTTLENQDFPKLRRIVVYDPQSPADTQRPQPGFFTWTEALSAGDSVTQDELEKITTSQVRSRRR